MPNARIETIEQTNKKKLAVFSPKIGQRSETFIQRHIESLLPGEVVAITFDVLPDAESTWKVSCPLRAVKDLSFEQSRFGRHMQRVFPHRLINSYYRHRIAKWLVRHNVEILLGQYLHQSWPFIELARELGIRFFGHAHGYDLSKYWRRPLWRQRYADYKHADGVIVVNKIMRQRMLEAGVPNNLIHVVPYGVDVPEDPPTRPENDGCRFLAVGRMVGKKAPLKTLEAFRIARETYGNISLDYVGTGPLFEQVQAYVDELQLSESVRLHGGQSHDFVLDLMTQCDIFVQHSIVDPETGDEEGVPVAILEAMAHALPVVATLHAGIPEAVETGVTGMLGKEGAVDEMAKAMIELARSPEQRRHMGLAGWRVAKESFTWEVERRRLREIMGL